MLNLMMITNNVEIAKYAIDCGVDRIFIDLERIGKLERQGHLDTLISAHSMNDIVKMKKGIGDTELLVRLNPLYDGTKKEIDNAIENGADILMLPMFQTAEQLLKFNYYVNNRVKVMPLVETKSAYEDIDNIIKVDGITEIFIGLNDLHLSLGLTFMFEPLLNGMMENMSALFKNKQLPFGFGGVARIGEGELPAENIIREHIKIGSTSVILSRTFHRNAKSYSDLIRDMDLKEEVAKIRREENLALKRDESEVIRDHNITSSIINNIIQKRNGAIK